MNTLVAIQKESPGPFGRGQEHDPAVGVGGKLACLLVQRRVVCEAMHRTQDSFQDMLPRITVF